MKGPPFAQKQFESLGDGFVGEDHAGFGFKQTKRDLTEIKLWEAYRQVVRVNFHIRYTQLIEGRDSDLLPRTVAFLGENQGTALVVQFGSQLLLQFHPTQPCFPHPAGIHLICPMDRT